MSLKDRIADDNARLMNTGQFGEKHQWNDTEITCVLDSETALKRKNNNVVDVAWDFSSEEIVVIAPASAFDKKPMPQQRVLLDKNFWIVLQVGDDEGMLNILLARKVAKELQ